MSHSIQFRDSGAVVTAYENIKCSAWAIAQGGQFIFKYAGETVDESTQALVNFLEMINSGTNALYTLRVYEGITDRLKIKANTPYDYSFNFRLNEDEGLITNNQLSRLNNQGALMTKLSQIEARLDKEDEEEEEDEDETMRTLGKIDKLMSNPTVARLAQMIFGTSIAQQPGQPGAISGVEQDHKIAAAIPVLKTLDSRLGDHLEKLAEIGKESKPNFDFLLSTLDQMAVGQS